LDSPLSYCAIDPPCAVPTWSPVWELNISTVMQPTNYSGLFNPAYAAKWGLVSFDWSNAMALWWDGTGRNRNKTTCEELLVEQAAKVKAINPKTKVFVYRNLELALQFLSSERAAMNNSSLSGYFLKYRNGTIYNEPITQGDQFFWDFRNSSAGDYFIKEVVMGRGGTSAGDGTLVDGVFTDDVRGLGEEHPYAAERMGLTKQEVAAIILATQEIWNRMATSLLGAHKYNWQMFGNEDGVKGSVTKQNCVSYMTGLCKPEIQKIPMMMGITYDQATKSTPDIQQNIAAFLITRGPYAYIGYGWMGSFVPPWSNLFDLNVGEPVGLCEQTEKNVFSRRWTKGSATLDCNTWTAKLAF